MPSYELTMMVPVKVVVEDVANVAEACQLAEDSLIDWSTAQNGGKPVGLMVVMLESREI